MSLPLFGTLDSLTWVIGLLIVLALFIFQVVQFIFYRSRTKVAVFILSCVGQIFQIVYMFYSDIKLMVFGITIVAICFSYMFYCRQCKRRVLRGMGGNV